MARGETEAMRPRTNTPLEGLRRLFIRGAFLCASGHICVSVLAGQLLRCPWILRVFLLW